MRLFTTTALAVVLTVPGIAIAQTETDQNIEVEVDEVENVEQVQQQTGETPQTDAETQQAEGVRQAEGTQRPTLTAGQIVPLGSWDYDENIYARGWSADEFIDEMEVYGQAGDDIGDVEDLILDPDGKLTAVIAEVGGFWEIGDTHVSVPWDQVEVDFAQERVSVPVAEENVGDYEPTDPAASFPLEAGQTGEQVTAGVDDVPTAPNAFRVSELIGDYARIRGKDDQQQQTQRAAPTGMMAAPEMAPGSMTDYGYVSDVIIRDDEVAAVVVQSRGTYGAGYRAYPYYGQDYGWRPGDRYYDMPYTEEESGELEEFDYGELEYQPQED